MATMHECETSILEDSRRRPNGGTTSFGAILLFFWQERLFRRYDSFHGTQRGEGIFISPKLILRMRIETVELRWTKLRLEQSPKATRLLLTGCRGYYRTPYFKEDYSNWDSKGSETCPRLSSSIEATVTWNS